MNIRRYTGRYLKVRRLQGVVRMATQIAATPIVYGVEARKILKEAQTKPTERAKENGKKLMEFFNSIMLKED